MDILNRALKYSFLLLKYRQRSRDEMAARLKSKGFTKSVIDKVLACLEDKGYLNDREFVSFFFNKRIDKGYGKKKIIRDIGRFGVDSDIIEDVSAKIDSEVDYKEKIREIALRRRRVYKGKKEREMVFRYLAQRGFSYEDISEVCGEIFGIEK